LPVGMASTFICALLEISCQTNDLNTCLTGSNWAGAWPAIMLRR
jgi:hypothetical protein